MPDISIEERLKLLDAGQTFSSLKPDILEDLAGRMGEITYQPGQAVVTEGEEADRLFVVASGRAEVSSREGDEVTILATLEKGDIFGEMAFLTGEHKRKATVAAVTELQLLFLNGEAFNHLLTTYPELRNSVQQIVETRTKVNFLRQCSPFRPLPPNKLRELLAHLEEISVEAGTIVMRQGETGQECYLIISGKMEVLIGDEEQSARKIATLYPGSIVGEATLITEEPRNATVRAIERCELLVIKRDTFIEIVTQDVQLHNQMLALARQRDRPCRIEKVIVHEQDTIDGDTFRVLKNPQRGTYVRLSPEGWFIWERLDGHHTLKDLTLDFMNEWKTLAPGKIAAIIAQLNESGFLKSKALREEALLKAPGTVWWQRIHFQRILRRILEWNLALKHSDSFFSLLYRLFGKFLFSKVVQALLVLVSISGLIIFFILVGRVSPFLHDSSKSWSLIPILIPTLIVAVILHEIGHGITTKYYGREVSRAGIGWYWFGPVAFVDTTDMWTAGKWPRIFVSFAGPYTEVFLAGAASYIAWVSPSLFVSALLWQFALVSYMSTLMNFNPLLEYDGYYILSNLLNRPNLRRRSLEWLGQCLRGKVKEHQELRTHWIELTYSIAAVIYILFMAFSFATSFRILIGVHLNSFLPSTVSLGIQWLIFVIIVLSASMTIVGEMKVFKRCPSDK